MARDAFLWFQKNPVMLDEVDWRAETPGRANVRLLGNGLNRLTQRLLLKLEKDMEIKQRDYAKYPNPSDEPMDEKFARLGLRLKEPGEDVISWGQNAFVTPPQAQSSSPASSETLLPEQPNE